MNIRDSSEHVVENLIKSNVLSVGDGYRAKNSELSSAGIPFARAGNIDKGFDFGNADYFPIENLNRVGAKRSRVGDIVFTSKGTVGRFAFVDENATEFVYSPQLCYWRSLDHNIIHPRYLYYWMHSREFLDQVHAVKGQTDMADYVSLTDQRKMKIILPKIDEQKQIASILHVLDDKIDLLHRQNKTLEAMAETLFRQWFVEETEESWEETNLYDSIQLVGGGTPKTTNFNYWDGEISWLSGGDISSNHKGFILTSEKTITQSGLENSSARLLPQYSTIISARGTVGKYCLLGRPMTFSQSNYGIIPKDNKSFFFTYLLVNHTVEHLQSAAYGSVFDTITTNTFKEHKLLLPATDLINQFDDEVRPLFLKMFSNSRQIQTLKNLRDNLLPKLMNGTIIMK